MVRNVMIQAEDAQSAQLLLQRFAVMGDQDAFRILVLRHTDFVYSVCRRELSTSEEAQDITQEVFVVLARKADSLRKDTVLHAWLFRVAINLCRQARRKELRRRNIEQQAQSSSSEQSHREVDSALARLPDADRAVLVLRYIQGLSIREVAWEIGVTEDSARMRINRALTKLRKRLGYVAIIQPLVIHPAPKSISTMIIPRPLKVPAVSILSFGCIAAFVVVVWPKGSSSNSATLRANRNGAAFGAGGSLTGGHDVAAIDNQTTQELLPIYGKVTIVVDGKPGFTGETWRSKDVTRWRSSSLGKPLEAEIKAGVVRSIVDPLRFPEPNVVAIIVAPETRRAVETDLFEAALLELPRYIYHEGGLKPILLPTDGKSGMKITGDGGRSYTVWVDSSHRNLVKKVDYEIGQFHFISTVEKWSNLGQGRWIAAEVQIKSWFNGQASPDRTVLISSVKTGKDVVIPAMPSPTPGSLVKDEFRHTVYKVDGRWNRVSEETKVGNGDIGSK